MIHIEDTQRVMQGEQEGRLVAPVGLGGQPRMVGPVAMVAHLPPMTVEPWGTPVDADVRPHPHIGLGAVTYLLEGHVTHRDSLGTIQEIEPGAVACTVAGRGVVHSERLERLRLHGGTLHLFQILIALADGHEDAHPAFHYVRPDDVRVERGQGATIRRLVGAGSAIDEGLPSPVFIHEITLEPGAGVDIYSDAGERAVYVIEGTVEVDGRAVTHGHRAVLDPEAGGVAAAAEGAHLLAFGGAPMGPRYLWWNYLHSSLDAIKSATAAWRAEDVPLPRGDTESFTPAPGDDGRPLRILNPPEP